MFWQAGAPQEVLGEGTFGTVVAAKYGSSRRPVAVKFMKPIATPPGMSPTAVAQLAADVATSRAREVAMLKCAQGHPNVLELVTTAEIGFSSCIVTERCEEVRSALIPFIGLLRPTKAGVQAAWFLYISPKLKHAAGMGYVFL